MNSTSLSSQDDLLYGCLVSQHGLGYGGVGRLLGCFGSAEGVYGASPTQWREVHPSLSDAMVASLTSGPRPEAWHRLREQCAAQRIVVTAPGWTGYPQVLTDLESPPPLLFVRGEWRTEDARAVALVGTRMPTAYGREVAFTLARDLAAADCTVVSGLALGIDAAAHRGALSVEGGRTLAVVGCGLDIDYPAENRDVRARLEVSSGECGAILSEFPPGTPAWPSHFPRRNRLISALARATVVVEAGDRSGALLTASHTRSQNRLLFAVPGPIFNAVSAGTNALIRKGARLATSATDILVGLEEEVSMGTDSSGTEGARRRVRRAPSSHRRAPAEASARVRSVPPSRAIPAPDASGHPVLALWGADEACPLDTLAARAVEKGVWPRERAAAALLESLLQLELRGLVRRLPGAVYARVLRR